MPTKKPKTPATPAAAAYQKWYKKHREEFNKKRAEKYAKDSTLQEKTRERQRVYRETKPREIATGQHYRLIKGKHTEVFRIGTVAEMISRDEQTIRSWERKKYIPKPIVKSAHRFYTLKQVKLLQEFGDLSTLVRWEPSVRDVAIQKKVEEIKALWAGE